MSRRVAPPKVSGQSPHSAKQRLVDEARQYLQDTQAEVHGNNIAKNAVEFLGLIIECTWAFLCELWKEAIVFVILLIVGFIWYGIYTGTVDGMMVIVQVLNVLSDVMSGLSSAISAVSGGLSSAASFLSGGHTRDIQVSIPSGLSLFQPFYGDVEGILATCEALDTWQKVLMVFVKVYISKRGCYIQRFFYPSPVIFFVLYFTVGWFTEDPAPYPWANCQEPLDQVLCMWLRFYLIVINFMIPAIVIGLFIYKFWPVISTVLKWTWELLRFVLKTVLRGIQLLRAIMIVRASRERRNGF